MGRDRPLKVGKKYLLLFVAEEVRWRRVGDRGVREKGWGDSGEGPVDVVRGCFNVCGLCRV